MTRCSHDVQIGAGYECSACVTTVTPVEERTEEREARHALNKPLIAAFDALRTGNHDGPLPHLAPPYCGVCSPYGGSDPEHTGVSGVQAEVLAEVQALRRNVARYAHAKEYDEPSSAAASYIAIKGGLDRIEAAVRRGEQR